VIERWKPYLEKARLTNLPVNTGEYRVTCKDGSIRNCELYATFISDSLIVTFNDITDRKQTENLLRESGLKYWSLIEHSSDVVFCVNKNCKYRFTIQVFASTFRKTPDYFSGKTFWDIYPKEHADYRQAASLRLFETGKPQSIEV
jgi:PAS domain-containing protein